MQNYDECRGDIHTGDLVYLSQGKTLASCITQFITNSPYFHVGIAFWIHDPEYKSRLMLLEAHSGGRRIISLSAYKEFPMDIVRVHTDWASVCDNLLDNSGSVPYGYLNYVAIGFKEIFGLRKYITRKISSLKAEVCSEMVSTYVNAGGENIPTQISPGEQFRVLKGLGYGVCLRIL